MHRCVFILLLFLAPPAIAAEVLKIGSTQRVIAISHEQWRRWSPKDYVCVYQAGREIVCGTVAKVTPKGAIVRLDQPSNEVARGDSVRLAASGQSQGDPPPPPLGGPPPETGDELVPVPAPRATKAKKSTRKPALALLDSVEKDKNSQEFGFNFSGGISAGLSFFFPQIDIQRTLTPSIAVGLVPVYFRASAGDSTVGALGAFLTVNYYGNEFFRGMWVQGGPGMFSFSVTTGELEEKANSFSFLGTVGWRGYWDLGLNIGVAGGFQFVAEPQVTSVEIRSTGIQPLVVLDLGFSF